MIFLNKKYDLFRNIYLFSPSIEITTKNDMKFHATNCSEWCVCVCALMLLKIGDTEDTDSVDRVLA